MGMLPVSAVSDFLRTRFPSPAPTAPHTADEEPEVDGFSASRLDLSVQIHLERTVSNEAGRVLGRETIDVSVRIRKLDLTAAAEEPSALERLQDYFSPENVAQRIADFVTRGFASTSFGASDTPDSRRGFLDFILPYIRQGVDSALEQFGMVPDDVRRRAEDTFALTKEKLEKFAAQEFPDVATEAQRHEADPSFFFRG